MFCRFKAILRNTFETLYIYLYIINARKGLYATPTANTTAISIIRVEQRRH